MLRQEIWAQRLRLWGRSGRFEHGHRRRTWNQADTVRAAALPLFTSKAETKEKPCPPSQVASYLTFLTAFSVSPNQTSSSPSDKQPQRLQVCPECPRSRRLSEMPEDGVRGRKVSRGRKGRNCFMHFMTLWLSLVSENIPALSLFSLGIKAASAVESVVKAWSPRLLLTETGRFFVKVCVQQVLIDKVEVHRHNKTQHKRIAK